jgi:hypothetical protein
MKQFIFAFMSLMDNTYTLKYQSYSLVGFHDADGHYEVRCFRRADSTIRFEIFCSFDQNTENKDTLEIVINTIGYGKVRDKTTNRLRAGNTPAKPSSTLVYYFSTPGGSILLNILLQYKPLSLSKLLNFSIALKTFEFIQSNYEPFIELDCKNGPLTTTEVLLTESQLRNLSKRSKLQISFISMIYLKFKNAASFYKTETEKQRDIAEMNSYIDFLLPKPYEKKYGLILGKYFLSRIKLEQTALNTQLLDPNFILPDDYIVGLHIGDGSFEVSKIYHQNYIEIRPTFNVAASSDCINVLYAFKNRFRVGSVKPTNSQRTGYCYLYQGNRLVREVLIPLFDKYIFPKSKGIQFILWRKISDLLAEKKHLTPSGYKRFVALDYQLNKYHKKPYRRTKQEALEEGRRIFNNRNMPF